MNRAKPSPPAAEPVLLFDGLDDSLGISPVGLSCTEDRLAVRVWLRFAFEPRHQPGVRWRRSAVGRQLSLTVKPGRLRLYEKTWGRFRYGQAGVRDQSFQAPVAFSRLLRYHSWVGEDGAAMAAAVVGEAGAAAAAWGVDAARRHGHPVPANPRHHGAGATLLALTYPLLVPVLDSGRTLPDALPTTLTPILDRPGVRQAAVAAFGAAPHHPARHPGAGAVPGWSRRPGLGRRPAGLPLPRPPGRPGRNPNPDP